ncbi:MAG: hypothetical protein GY778_09475 [bacterium]|nr:hypothetical protein [bacterium]
MRIRRFRAATVAALGAIVLIGGCSQSPVAVAGDIADQQELPILRSHAGTYANFSRPVRLAIRDAGILAMLPVDLGPVDFEREMVLLAALGPTSSPEWAIRIRRVWRDGSELRAQVEKRLPGADCLRRTTPANPYHLIVVPRCDRNVRGFAVKPPDGAFEPGAHRPPRRP